jgi:hypothetical protein
MANGLPAIVLTFGPRASPFAPRVVIQVRTGGDGRVQEIYLVQATKKLAALTAAADRSHPH